MLQASVTSNVRPLSFIFFVLPYAQQALELPRHARPLLGRQRVPELHRRAGEAQREPRLPAPCGTALLELDPHPLPVELAPFLLPARVAVDDHAIRRDRQPFPLAR